MKTLVNAYQYDSNRIKHIYLEDGIPKTEIVAYKPFLGLHAMKAEESQWTDIHGKKVKVKVFDSIMDMKAWKKENENYFEILGDIAPHLQFMATRYRTDIPFQTEGLCIWNIDLECTRDVTDATQTAGFPTPGAAKFPITAITIQDMVKNEYYVLGYKDDYTPKNKNVTYFKCENEQDLLNKYIDMFNKAEVHILTGFNIVSFDVPYIVNRVNRILGPEAVKRMSLDRVVKQKNFTNDFGQEDTTYLLQGTIIWDFQQLYRKYIGEPRESWSLNFISQYELGQEKISYSDEYESLENLYYENYELFLTYNIQDVELVYNLNNKFRFIELALSIVHKAKCSPESIFGTVQPWDCIYYSELLDVKKLCPANKNHVKEEFIGGYVKDPTPGFYKWLKVFDIVSSYPNQIRSSNLSSETIINDNELPPELVRIKKQFGSIEACIDVDSLDEIQPILEKYCVTFTSNGYFFRNDIEGFIPKIYSKLFMERVQKKKDLKKAKADGNTELARQLDLVQYALKILLNSGYGAIANPHSRYFDIRIAEAITSNGQLCVRGIDNYIEQKKSIKTIYCDTDSVFLNLEPLIEKRYNGKIPDNKTVLDFILKLSEQIIEPCINEFLDKLRKNLNMQQLTIRMEAECVATSTIFVAKKRYIMNKIWDEGTFYLENPKQKVRGVEIVRTSTPQWCRDKLKKAVQYIFETESNDKVIEFIEQCRKEFYTLPFETVAFPRGVQFSSYTLESKGLPIHVRSAFVYNKLLRELNLTTKYPLINTGDKIKFCLIKEPNKVKSNVVGISNKFPEEMSFLKIDYPLQFQKAFLDPLKNIIESMDWEIERKASLDDFFS